jgi:hypothetical protein
MGEVTRRERGGVETRHFGACVTLACEVPDGGRDFLEHVSRGSWNRHDDLGLVGVQLCLPAARRAVPHVANELGSSNGTLDILHRKAAERRLREPKRPEPGIGEAHIQHEARLTIRPGLGR